MVCIVSSVSGNIVITIAIFDQGDRGRVFKSPSFFLSSIFKSPSHTEVEWTFNRTVFGFPIIKGNMEVMFAVVF